MKRRCILLLCLTLCLTACESRDVDLVMDFVNDWMLSKGMVDENGTPTLAAAGVLSGFTSTGDDAVDAAIQAGGMLKGIKQTDKLAKEAKDLLKKSPPDYTTAKKKMDAAIDARPDDWGYRNQRAALAMAQGNAADANADFSAAESACAGNTLCLTAMYQDRSSQLYQTVSLQPSYDTKGEAILPSCSALQASADTYQKLVDLTTGDQRIHYQNMFNNQQQNIQPGRCL